MRMRVILAVAAMAALSASAVTLRTKSDLRLWQTVMDRSVPLSWAWEDGADAVTLTFSNQLKRAVTSVRVVRTSGARRGSCVQPISPTAEEGLFAATLVQTSGGAEIARETAELAYVPGAGCVPSGGGSVAAVAATAAVSRPITVRARPDRAWWRVERSRLSAFDASWWDRTDSSGYETIEFQAVGWRRVERVFGGETVDWADLQFLYPGTILFVR